MSAAMTIGVVGFGNEEHIGIEFRQVALRGRLSIAGQEHGSPGGDPEHHGTVVLRAVPPPGTQRRHRYLPEPDPLPGDNAIHRDPECRGLVERHRHPVALGLEWNGATEGKPEEQQQPEAGERERDRNQDPSYCWWTRLH